MSSRGQWPDVRDEDRWLIALMEERLENASQSPSELQARARELRAEAQRTDIEGVRGAAVALAERYEQRAAAQAGAR